jgi:uncharacterized membrane protein
MMDFISNIKSYIHIISSIVELVGVIVIFIGILYSFYLYFFSQAGLRKNYTILRQNLGKSILLGLEILIAADIMSTVVTEPTLRSVTVLAMIVLVRTFMSLSLEVELEGKFPWQKNN